MGRHALVLASWRNGAGSQVLTAAPLPTWRNLFGALLRRSPSDANLAAPWHGKDEVAGWLSRSAWSLALIALWRQRRAPDAPLIVWVPDFFCNASLAALRQTGAKLIFYPVTDQLMPDLAACRRLADAARPDICLVVHYFGRPTPSAGMREFCAQHRAWLIEDATHVLRPVKGIADVGDCVLYSPHKCLSIPDGAVLVVRTNGPCQLRQEEIASFGAPNTWPDQLCSLHHAMPGLGDSGRTRTLTWLAKRVLQKCGVTGRGSLMPFAEPLPASVTPSPTLGAPAMSSLARRLLAALIPTLDIAARRRQHHQQLWDAQLLGHVPAIESAVSAAERCAHREWTPYLASYCVAPDVAESVYEKWRQQGMLPTTWPDLAPEVTTNRERHAVAWKLRHDRIYLPVHQTLSTTGILARGHGSAAIAPSASPIRLVWGDYSRSEWQQWMAQADRSNLLQSWSYGEAKADCSGWRVKRGVFYQGREPIAVVQALVKRLGFVSLVRINRGPLFLGAISWDEQSAVWRELARFGCVWHGRILTVAPELNLSGSSLVMMHGLGFRQSTPRAWESVWVDLDLDLEVLRKRLDGKWRNMLSFSEKAQLTLEVGSDDSMFDWMMAQYEELMQEKDFRGPPVALLRSLRRHSKTDNPPLILRVLHQAVPVAGICIARHGAAATYLVGWNGAQGRGLKANQYLLWQAIMHLKQLGLWWFDLGGLDEARTPGISAFKLGLNGERYELVGEYWKW